MPEYKIKFTEGFQAALKSTGSTIMVSVYQAGKILLINVSDQDKLALTPISYKKPMGLAINGTQLGITTKNELHVYADSPELARKAKTSRPIDHLYFPRQTFHTGTLDLHDLCFIDNKPWAVATQFSCIASFDSNYNFTPEWKPHFITEITPEDRCHLNGLALENGQLQYVTALGSGNEKGSWRDGITTSGILMSIPENKILLDNLSMPHSPKIVDNDIYLLESAKGELVRINRDTLQKETVVKINGMVRGLSIIGHTAFIGISKVREKSSTFTKLDDHVKAEHAAIYAIDLYSGMILGQLTFTSAIEEIYDIQCIPNTNKVGILGLYDERHEAGFTIPDGVFWKSAKESSKSE
ncbi:TIGR03032 family protein [bacterium]|nr:TIGR03032 family protein [bacterium]